MIKLDNSQKYWAEFEIQPNGSLKVVRSNRLTKVNQHKNKWTQINSRDFARAINGRELVLR